jgi:hypothetical protein
MHLRQYPKVEYQIVNRPNQRHHRHAELDELISASSAHRAVEESRAERRTQYYANIDDEYDDAMEAARRKTTGETS